MSRWYRLMNHIFFSFFFQCYYYSVFMKNKYRLFVCLLYLYFYLQQFRLSLNIYVTLLLMIIIIIRFSVLFIIINNKQNKTLHAYEHTHTCAFYQPIFFISYYIYSILISINNGVVILLSPAFYNWPQKYVFLFGFIFLFFIIHCPQCMFIILLLLISV